MANKRKKLLINPNFQLRFIGWMSGVALTVTLIFYSAHLYFFRTYLLRGKNAGLPPNHVFFIFLSDQYRDMNWIFVITSIIVFMMIFFIGLVLSHRIAGPLDRFRNHMNHCREGKRITQVHFRSEDYFQELAEAYNKHIALLEESPEPETSKSKEQERKKKSRD